MTSDSHIYDALKSCRSTHTKIKRFPHLDMKALDILLAKSSAKHKVIVSEGIFSMIGRQSCIPTLVRLKKKYQTTLVIDDAHCFGVKGKRGRGSSDFCQQGDIDILICPLGKALSMTGAIVAASRKFINELIQSARPFIYSTAQSSAHALGLIEALHCVIHSENKRTYLDDLVRYFKDQTKSLSCMNSNSAIQFLVCEKPSIAVNLFNFLNRLINN